MEINPKYSILIYYDEINDRNVGYITKLLKGGIIIHIFVKKLTDDIVRKTEIIDQAIKNNLLYIYQVDYKINDNSLIAVDNKIIDKEIYSEICNDKYSEFNHEQYEIITADENSNYIVISGAGTGKTTTMINRIIYLKKVSENFSFNKIALITFTNKASREMREKLINVLEKYYMVTRNPEYLNMMDEASRIIISTIHGFSKKLINEFGKSINLNKNVKVKSFKYARKKAITESLQYVYENHKDMYDIIKYYPIYEIENKFLNVWEKLDNYSIDVNSDQYSVDFGVDDKGFSKLIEIVIKKAQEIIDSNKDYDIEIVDLMKKLVYKDLFNNAKGKFDLIMVDEFQDSDNIQINFVSNFCYITGSKLLVVGDEKQSIYRFRGAEYTSFYKLKENLKKYNMPVKEFTMVRNYRTNSKLLEEINSIFINIDKRVDKFNYQEKDYIYSLVNKDADSKIDYVSLNEDGLEIDKFYEDLLNNVKENEYVSVLFRSNSDLRDFKKFCDSRSIPCRIDISGSFFRHESVRDFYIMIKALIVNDNSVKYSFIETPYICKVINKEIILCEESEQISEYLDNILSKSDWDRFKNYVNNKNILELIDLIIEKLKPVRNYYVRELLKAKRTRENYKKIAYVKTLEYKINLEHLLYIIRDNFADDISSIFAIENFLRLKISTDNTIDVRRPEARYDREFLQCSTVHKAKGLEYDYVVMPKLTNPFIMSKAVDIIVRNDKNKVNIGYKIFIDENEYTNSYYSDYIKDEKTEIIGEESRLLYVAMTRCKRKLYLNADGIIATEGQNNWKNLIGGGRGYV